MNETDSYRLRSLNNTLDVIEVLAASTQEVGLSEITKQASLSKSAVHRILLNLVSRGYVNGTAGGRYRLSIRFWEIGMSVFSRWGIQDLAHPHLQKLLEIVDENVLLAVYDRSDVIYVEKAESDHDVRAYSPVGGRAPAHSVASGLMLLAHQEPKEVDHVLAHLERFTPNTIVDPAELRRVLVRTREVGYAVNIGQRRIDVNGVAAPITDWAGRVSVAISISGPAYRFGRAELDRAIVPLLETAETISARFAARFEDPRPTTPS